MILDKNVKLYIPEDKKVKVKEEDDSEVLPYFQSELDKRTMVELLDLALLNGAPMAPVLSTPEAVSSEIFRDGFVNANGSLNLPFIIKRLQNDV